MPNRFLELRNDGLWQAKWFLFWCQTRGCGKPSLSFPTGLKLPDAASKRFKRFKLFETCQTGCWSCQTRGCGKTHAKLAAVASQGFFLQKLTAVASQGFLFLLARNCWILDSRLWQAKAFLFQWPETAGCSLQKSQRHQTPQTRRNVPNRFLELRNDGLWQAKWFLFWCQTRGCGKPRLSIFYWPESPGCSLQTLQTPQTLQNVPNRFLELRNDGLWQAKWLLFWCQTNGCGLFVLARNCRMLPQTL